MLDLLSMLGGPRPMFINPGLLARQLGTEIADRDRVMALVSFASQFDAVLRANPAIEALLAGQQALAVAALYGATLRIVNAEAARTDLKEGVTDDFARLQEQLAQVVRLAQVEITEPQQTEAEEADIDSLLATTVND